MRLTNTGLAASKPCEGCLQTLREFGVKNVYYSTRNGIEVDHSPFLFYSFFISCRCKRWLKTSVAICGLTGTTCTASITRAQPPSLCPTNIVK